MESKWENEKDELERLINVERVSYAEIGRRYGCSGNNIKKVAKKLGIELPQRRSINPNETFNKGINIHEGVDPNKICPKCGGLKTKEASLCLNCANQERADNIKYKTLGYFISGQKYLSTKCSEIRKHARKVLENSSREKVCEYCHNHEFDEILEVHHIKGILEFPEDTLISEINSENNLIWLCPNHHTMLEKGLIQLTVHSSNG